MKRFHVHLSVASLADSIRFYSTVFGSPPTVEKSDYAKWMVEDPRLNFAISTRGHAPGLNHLGLQVDSDAELGALRESMAKAELAVVDERGAACCYASSDKYWITDPQGIAWETYHTLAEIPTFGATDTAATACCSPETIKPPMPGAAKPRGCCA